MAEKSNMDMWQCGLSNPSQRLGSMRKRNLFSDCKFEVEGKTFDAHKIVLAMSSPVFEKMFFGSFPQQDNRDPISIDDLDAATFEVILKHIYESSTKIESFEEAEKVLYAARKYMLDTLEGICVSYLKSIVDWRNAQKVFHIAEKYGIQHLQNSCRQIFKEHVNDILPFFDYNQINIDLLLSILKLPGLKCTEPVLFAMIEKYVKAKNISIGDDGISALCSSMPTNKNRKISLKNRDAVEDTHDEEIPKLFEAIKSIRFLAMKASEFANGPALSKLLSDKEKVAIFANITAQDAKQPLPEGFSSIRVPRF